MTTNNSFQPNLSTTICGVTFKNPVTTASGTFGVGREFEQFFDIGKLGAVTIKGISDKPWIGNKPARIAETYGGMINSVGLQNKGVEHFINEDLPFLQSKNTRIIANVCGHTIEEYVSVVKSLQNTSVDLLELNISCPNVSEGGITFGTDCLMVEKVVYEVKKHAKQPLIVKLSPNVTSISAVAKSAEKGGADGFSLINTLLGMRIDIHSKKPVISRNFGGLSGPCIKPVALKMVWEVANCSSLPIIAMGGIMNYEDAIEFIMAGATMVAVGTANFINPYSSVEIIDGIEKYMIENKIKNLSEIRNIV